MKKLKKLDKKKGVAGLNLLLGIISMLFMIGILVMVFVMAGQKLSDTLAEETKGVLNNQTITLLNQTAVATNITALRSIDVTSVTIWNSTGDAILDTGNYTFTPTGHITATTGCLDISPATVLVYADYTYLEDTTASATIVDTTYAIGDTTDWFSTFIVIASLVVLILLVVILINSIRGSGITEGDRGPGEMGA